MSDWTAYQTDYLFLLIGANPLPNYVAALLLAKDNGTIYLLHSGGAHGTGEVAASLQQAIQNRCPQLTVIPREIDEADSARIAQKMEGILNDIDAHTSVGLHYTGGTKAMAVHAYRAVEKAFPTGVFSYLDARTLSLMIDGRKGKPSKPISVGQTCSVELAELLALHGYDRPAIRRVPFQPGLCQALARIHSDPRSFKQWRAWIQQEKFQSLPNTSQYPLLENVKQAFDNFCGGQATPELLAQQLGQETLVACSKWLIGDWLEEFVLWAINQVAHSCGLSENYSVDLKIKKPRRHKFQLDVAAIRGYQLFALSCMASDRKEKCTEHLFEAYVRARQMGGDEARIGLVCCYHDPAALQQEIEETWFTEGRVKVFGVQDLPNLPARLKEWFETANDPKTA